ncbi:uncharacterized protein LOC107981908 [Nasonia vitripennis]|uniref:Uncharacterized protein n=1 Tax=Nasonia vitripennis TaxID=7425 RepID=A0A7M7T814_NASVI|nr:uncharacterized protein LOC107981908 [Nasonia vitripennis]
MVVIKINKIIKTDQKIYLDVLNYKIVKSIFSSPCDSSLLQMYEVESTDSSQHSSIVLIDDIHTKIIKMNMSFSSSDECRCFAVPLFSLKMMLNEHDHATFFAEMDDQSVLLDQFPYHVVEFVAAGRKPKVRKTDIVAIKWLQYDKQKKRVVTRYPPPPYDTEKSDELDSALKELSDAPSTLSTYTVVLRGKAVSLGDAYRKHELLTHQKTTLTAESGESDTEAEQRAANLIRQEQLRSAAKSFNDSLRK